MKSNRRPARHDEDRKRTTKERRELSMWQHVEKTLREGAAGDDPVNISVTLQIVLQAERAP